MTGISLCALITVIYSFAGLCLQAQVKMMEPSWTAPLTVLHNGPMYDVSDSTVVIARNDTVYVHNAKTGILERAWKAPFIIDGICLPKHKRGVILVGVDKGVAASELVVSDFSDNGEQEAVDIFKMSGNEIAELKHETAKAISPSGRFVVFGKNLLLDRYNLSIQSVGRSNIVHVSFNRDETVMAFLAGRYYYGIRGGEPNYERENGFQFLDYYATRGCKIRPDIPQMSTDEIVLQFIPHTSEFLHTSKSYDICSGKQVNSFPAPLLGIVSDNGMRTVGYEKISGRKSGNQISLVVTDLYLGTKQYIATPFNMDPVYGSPFIKGSWFKMSPSSEIVVASDTVIRVYNTGKVSTEPRVSLRGLSDSLTENTPTSINIMPVPINEGSRVSIETDGKLNRNRYFFLQAGKHDVRVTVTNNLGVSSVIDTAVVVLPLPTTQFSVWNGRVKSASNLDFSPSGQRVATCGESNFVIDISGDSILVVETPVSEAGRSEYISFATEELAAFSRSFMYSERLPGPTAWLSRHGIHHRFLRIPDSVWTAGEQSVETISSGSPTTASFTGCVDKRRGRLSLFSSTYYYNRNEFSWSTWTNSGWSSIPICRTGPSDVAVDPSQDSPLLIDEGLAKMAWRANGKTGKCGDIFQVPAKPMFFVDEGRYLWSRSKIFNARTGELVKSVDLPSTYLPLPHTSLVMTSETAVTGKSDSTVLAFLHSVSGDVAGRLKIQGEFGRMVFDTSGKRLIVLDVQHSLIHVLDISQMLQSIGLDTFYVSTPKPLISSPDDSVSSAESDAESTVVSVESHPNPAQGSVNFVFKPRGETFRELAIVNELGMSIYESRVPVGDSSLTWNLRTNTGDRVAPGMYGYLFRAQDGSILQSGTFIVIAE